MSLELEVKLIFLHANKQSFFKLVLSFLIEVARDVQSTQNFLCIAFYIRHILLDK